MYHYINIDRKMSLLMISLPVFIPLIEVYEGELMIDEF